MDMHLNLSSEWPNPQKSIDIDQSERFCFPDADLVLQSSDSVRFKVHRKVLGRHSDAFADANTISDKVAEDSPEAMKLTESATVLDLLLSLVYRLDHAKPDLKSTKFQNLQRVANAAEKYTFDAASDLCEVYMCGHSAEHPLEVMKYAIAHNRVDAMDSAAPWLLGQQLDLVLNTFEEPKFLRAWAKYYSACINRLGDFYARQPDYITTKYHSFNQCDVERALPLAVLEAVSAMRTDPSSFLHTDRIFVRPMEIAAGCSSCFGRLITWKEAIAAGMDSVPKFSTFT